MSSSLDLLVKTLVDNSHKASEFSEEEVVDSDEIIKIVNEIKLLNKDDIYNNDSIKGVKKDYPDSLKSLEETLLNYMGENDLKIF